MIPQRIDGVTLWGEGAISMPFGPLPFGNDSPPVFSNADGISEILSRGISGLRSLSPANPDRFGSKTASCEIGDIQVIAIASPACHLEIEESPGWTLIVPYTSHITCVAEGRNFDLTPGNCPSSEHSAQIAA